MNILFLSSMNFLSKSGGGVCTKAHKEVVDKIGKKLGKTYFIFYSKEPVEEVHDKIMYIKRGKTIEKILSALRGYSPSMNSRVRKGIKEFIEKKGIDIVYIDDSLRGKFIKELKIRYPHLKVIAFFHNIEGVKLKEDKGLSLWKKIAIPIHARNEKLTAQWADRTIVLNQRDANLYKQLYGKAPFIKAPMGLNMPVGIDKGKFHLKNDVLSMLFVGGGTYPPFESASNVVKIVGTVDDLTPHYISADIVLSPIIEGGGMKTKTAESFSYGKRLIGTKEGLEGYWEDLPENIREKKVFQCDDPKEFASTIDMLAEQDFPKYDSDIRELAEQNYSYNSIYDSYLKAFDFSNAE